MDATLATDTAPRVFVNPNARDGAVDRLREAVRRTLGDHAGVIETKSSDESLRAIRTACDEGAPVVAAGGDGTVHAAINAVMSSEHRPPFGLLPMGTSNNFCRDLGVPLDVNAALEALRDGVPTPVDLVRITVDGETRYCATVATAGNADRVIDALEDDDKQQWGPWCYLRAALPVMSDLEGYDLQVTIDDGLASPFRVWNLIVANGRYAGGGLDVAPRAQLDDGLLDLVLIDEGEGLDLAALATDFLLSDYLEHERVTFRQARRVEIQSGRELRFLADGEAIGGRSFCFEAVPGALSVILPTDRAR